MGSEGGPRASSNALPTHPGPIRPCRPSRPKKRAYLDLISDGKTNKQIAEVMFLSECCVS